MTDVLARPAGDESPQHPGTGPGVSDVSVFTARAFESTPLAAVEEITGQVLDLFQAGRLPEATTARALEELVVADDDGGRWALGATSRRWYHQPAGEPWRLTGAPEQPERLVQPAAAAVSAALRLLGVDPDTVSLSTATETAYRPAAPVSASSLLDEIVDGYGD